MTQSASGQDGIVPRSFLSALFHEAVRSTRAEIAVPTHLPPPPAGRLIVVGAGKASAAMAQAAADHYGDAIAAGLIITRYGYDAPAGDRIEVVEAGHPTPDEAGLRATRRLLKLVGGLSAEDMVLCLISGGGSSLMVAPAGSLSLGDKQAVTAALLKAGADITEINCVRRHLSAVKGGRLARMAAPAQLHTLVISDVVGDSLCDIASGPTVGDPTTRFDALDILRRYQIDGPPSVEEWLADPASETVKPDDPIVTHGTTAIVASGGQALAVAAETARRAGVKVIMLEEATGEARSVAAAHARMVLDLFPVPEPTLLLSGGELTVTARGTAGIGGPNSEYALALALDLNGAPGVFALAADTDGSDGTGGHAGAFADPTTLSRAAAGGIEPSDFLSRHDSHTFLKALGDLFNTGPTLTNVNDFRAILLLPETSGVA